MKEHNESLINPSVSKVLIKLGSASSLPFFFQKKKEICNPSDKSDSISISFTAKEIEQLEQFLQFNIPFDVYLLDEVNTITVQEQRHLVKNESERHAHFSKLKESNSFILEPIALAMRTNHSRFYNSMDYDNQTETMTKLFALSICSGIETIPCIFIMREVYSLVQSLKVSTTSELNESSDFLTKEKISRLSILVYNYFLKEHCVFPLNTTDKILKNIRSQWQTCLFNTSEKSEENHKTKIPPLELMFHALNGIVGTTGIKKTISAPQEVFANSLFDKNTLYQLFKDLKKEGVLRHCPHLFEELNNLLGIKPSSELTPSSSL
ncbi:MAG: hypothetical protein LEGION0403_FIIPPAGN_00620 [Legionella sp.]|uniref:hypothetical protein n=1 Tax=Legionella sp. TaxID=459 RepID=UPI003D14E3D8